MNASIGRQLRQRREERALSLEQVSQATHIRLHYLQALEAGEFDALPSRAQARGFLRAYAGAVGLNGDTLLKSLEEGVPAQDAVPAGSAVAFESAVVSPAPAPVPAPADDLPRPDEEAAAIFADIGRQLQAHRELLGLSLEDVVRHTHLRKHYLVALEAGNLSALPSPVQGRGMLSNYATFLGLNPEPLLLRFAEGLQSRLAVRQAAQPETAPKKRPNPARQKPLPGPLRRLFSRELFLTAVIVLSLAGFVLWGAIRIFAFNNQSVASPTAPSIADVLLATDPVTTTPELTATPTSAADAAGVPGAMETPAAPGEDGEPRDGTAVFSPGAGPGGAAVQVYLTVVQRAWLRVLVDGEEEFSGRVLPGSAYTYAGDESVEILTGNGAALQIFFNQQDLGPMGQLGEVVNRIFTPQGVLAPTATVTPTGAPTPRGTPAPGVTPTSGGRTIPQPTATSPALP
jgi:cytoskeletal protein RodZ